MRNSTRPRPLPVSEKTVERYFKNRVKATGGETRKVRWLCQMGAPDRIAWWHFPNVALVELKAGKKHVDPLSPQGREIQLLRDTGWPVYEINSLEQVDEFIAKMTGHGVDPISG